MSSSAGVSSAPKREAALCSFGVVTDSQHCDEDDAWDFHHTRQRFYRAAVGGLERACGHFARASGVSEGKSVDFVVQLGDVLDGKAAAKDARALFERSVKPAFEKNGFVAGGGNGGESKEVHHLIGNHELYCFDRASGVLHDVLNTQRGSYLGEPRHFYSFTPDTATGFRFIVLDPYEISMLNGDPVQRQTCIDMLRKNNPNDILGSTDWLAGLTGPARRFLPYNGMVSAEQLAWLKEELGDARSRGQRVVVLSHVNVCPGASLDETLLWNYEEVLAVLQDHAGTVVACLYGHDHDGGYVHDDSGIHHKTFEAILETSTDAYGVIDCFDDRLELRGFGKVGSATWEFPGLK
jgi:manganese-dependent ADP-ribose/CDP-alcohol diphosphatase